MNRDESGAPVRIVFLMIDAIALAVIISPWLKKRGEINSRSLQLHKNHQNASGRLIPLEAFLI